ncbi:hypothetical protein LQ327_32265 [Actinomycetospora endophytica]|uniref:Replication initiation protein n=1 Tax=Actinomycetospora endophytica TaxID=2291215 RepID=A0ABS8PIK7_9PSEU|nr:hypothetical protein [Actinomycetospora endophytica]MCD2198057.1 hypothetical protein [Actinomycetospora endophytica]
MSDSPEGRRAGFEGLVSCGSVWACPVCAAKVAAKRAEELAAVLDAVHAKGGSAFMLTMTIRHNAGDRLGLNREERARRGVLDQRRRWRNRLEKLDTRRMARDDARAHGWDVDEHQAEADDIEETSIRREIARTDPNMVTVGPQARVQDDSDAKELADLNARRGCWDVVTDGWHAATSGRDWAQAQIDTGLLGWVRVTEVTDGGTPAILAGLPDGHGYSGNGWHVHVHALLCFPTDVSTEYAEAMIGAGMHARFMTKVRSLGFDSSEEHGWDLRKTRRGDGESLYGYFVKQAHEVTSGHRKEGKRRGGRAPMQLLADAVETYRAEDVARWWEWESAAEGRRQLEWSRGERHLRSFAGLGKNQTDEEVADDTLDGEYRLALVPETWHRLRSNGQGPVLLDVSETEGLDEAWRWLTASGLACTDHRCPATSRSSVRR